MGRTTRHSYDDKGNPAQSDDPLGCAVDTIYDVNLNRPIAVTRYLEGGSATAIRSRASYDANGNITSSTDPLNQTASYTYNAQGQIKTISLPAITGQPNRTYSLDYNEAGDLIKATDPLLQESRIMYDAAQRPASVIDARGVAIESYQYDNGDRLSAVSDALNKSTANQYDSAGRLSQCTDRKGQVSRFACDSQSRPISISVSGATRSIAYDLLGRISRVEETGSAGSSAESYAYDNADKHTLTYEYDSLDRLTRRTLNGADPTTYSYDNVSRLTSIGYRNQTTTYEWDNANRLTRKTLPNGIKQELAYDDADRLLSLTYRKSDNTVIETISYTYDAKGQRLSKTMSGASTRETPFSATYDNANRMSAITLMATSQSFMLVYDDNGNLTSKTETANPANATTYAWDSSDRLIGISAPSMSASFKYDLTGRRSEKSVNGNTVNYVYDGTQAIAEVTNGQVSASILSGPNIDEALARYAASGNRTMLTDALGSVIAQANDMQAIENYYSYTPYGETTTFGPDNGNTIQYTGRENDGTGLYYYRARYYDPVLKHFAQEDPIGLKGGINIYAYVGGNPLSYVDPFGLQETQWISPPGRYSGSNGPRSGNWCGGNWSGGVVPSMNGGRDGTAPPLNSMDLCCQIHDRCYGKNCEALPEGEAKQACLINCDRPYLECLRGLGDDCTKWPSAPQKGTEPDSQFYRDDSIRLFDKRVKDFDRSRANKKR